jgi:hypothetical protein
MTMMRSRRAALCLLIILALALISDAPRAFAQDAEMGSGEAAPARPLCSRFFGGLSAEEQAAYRAQCVLPKVPQPAEPASVCSAAGIANKDLAAQVERACAENIVSAYQTDVALRARNVALYEWQSSASDNMRILVWVVVLSGIAMAIYQLVIVMQIELWRARRATRRSADAAPAEPPAAAHQLEIGLGKVQVTSSIAGIVVLVISIAFLYLYLTEVYAMKPVG